ncbi:iron-containing redox enzyme family protein [Piscinibacter koreensis]|uniref:Iron-containing redox enzyme family protein n=1 Tax=Piscinibacter koreensis TaxID=2742824 RepID=A0A7Y6NP73_9BURK|nr:iron-containing redox enzyme family protein [Schlegelella koreensis]NUZ06807.1 iron-containing redox enzyme family protein [Schlegelella koreensis]
MKLSDHVLESSAEDYRKAFEAHPVFVALQNGTFSRTAYLAYLRETFHLIRHTTSIMARAASHVPDSQRQLRGWFLDQAIEEHNHDLLCITDIEGLGENPDTFLKAHPRRGAWGLITQCYHVAETNPVALLGYLLTTEGVGATYASKYADLLTSPLYGYRSNQVTFLRAHGGFDVEHVAEVKRLMDRLDADESTREAILAVRRFSIMYYAQMLADSLDGETVATPELAKAA